MKKVCVIGLGEVGSEVFREIVKTIKEKPELAEKYQVYGRDLNSTIEEKFLKEGYLIDSNPELGRYDIYIICVYTTQQVINIIKTIGELDDIAAPLIFIESTIDPSQYNYLSNILSCHLLEHTTAFVPHRFVPYDRNYWIFNIDRVFGVENPEMRDHVLDFYGDFMDKKLIHFTNWKTAILSKVVENTYRYWEIVLAQELQRSCAMHNVDFVRLRNACNTKFNINIMQARDGVGGKCLPKDCGLFGNYFKENIINQLAQVLNNRYKDELNELH